jgi:hypothetical protein
VLYVLMMLRDAVFGAGTPRTAFCELFVHTPPSACTPTPLFVLMVPLALTVFFLGFI